MNTLPSQMLRIDYESEGFPASSTVANGQAVLDTSWNELIWSAITVGRPNRMYVFRHGAASVYEAIFRLSLVRMALEQRGPRAYRLCRTDAVKTLDPSEKGAVNYFLGMILCKLFSARLLNAPWVMHLDVFRPWINPVLTGRSRPDLVGQTQSNDWVVLESKGRISTPYTDAKNKAKQQAQRVSSIDNITPSFQIGCITYFRNDVLQFFWCDPEPHPGQRHDKIKLMTDNSTWGYYYLPVVRLIGSQTQYHRQMLNEPFLMPIEGLDIEIGIYPSVLRHLLETQYDDARRICHENASEIKEAGYRADGIRVIAGASWYKPFAEVNERTEGTL
jgi:hypothetical protein